MATLTKHPNFSDLKQQQHIIFYNSVEEFRQGSAGQVFCSIWHGLEWLNQLHLTGGWWLGWKLHAHVHAHVCSMGPLAFLIQ